jgi:hypothetical protein
VVLAAGRFDGGVHLCGYAVEVALKAYRSFLVHDLDFLLHLSGREQHMRTALFSEWSDVASWDPEVRYRPPGHATQLDLAQMIESARKIMAELT